MLIRWIRVQSYADRPRNPCTPILHCAFEWVGKLPFLLDPRGSYPPMPCLSFPALLGSSLLLPNFPPSRPLRLV